MVPVFALLGEYKWLLLAMALAGSYGWGRHDGGALAVAEAQRDQQVAQVAVEAAQRGAALEIAKLEIKHVTTQRRIERETREVPVYRDCHHSAGGLLSLNAALENSPDPVGGGELPGDAGPIAGR